jgi:predicted GNAT family acetyltransferase
MDLTVRRLAAASELRGCAEPYLLRNEAQHNLILGLLATLERSAEFYGSPPYFAVVLEGSSVVAAAVMTPPYPAVLSLCDSPEALDCLARDLRAFSPEVAGVNAPVPVARRFAEAWQELTGESWTLGLAERCYRLDAVRFPAGVAGQGRLATMDDIELLVDWQMAFVEEATPWDRQPREALVRMMRGRLEMPPEVASRMLWEDGGVPVALAGYGSATPNSMRIGGVYTPPEHRRHGYGSAVTAAASQQVLDLGKRFVTLFTDLSNPTSNHIYQQIGFYPVYDAEMLRFGGR